MAFFTKESLETLRQRIDLLDVVAPHVEMKRAGAVHKGLCPFHEEKTPSFIVQKGDPHYHCFGCGAHGDAIRFLMEHQRLPFYDAVENLAQRFGVHLEKMESTFQESGPRKADLKATLHEAMLFYHYCLLHTEEGHQALHYLYKRGMTLGMIQRYHIGFSIQMPGLLRKVLASKGATEEWMMATGLFSSREDGGKREFFQERIMFPILDASGGVIGFSARKYREETYGGKYINTQETALFKKSRVLFGLPYCRKRIAKERHALLVEGQLDALMLIEAGLNIALATLGTAFGESHIAELQQLGVQRVYLAYDGDKAGAEATRKVGHLCQREGLQVGIVALPAGQDPDSFLRKEGIERFLDLIASSQDYIPFLWHQLEKESDLRSPAAKTQAVQQLAMQVRSWKNPLLIHESLKILAHLAQVPEEMIGIEGDSSRNYIVRKTANAGILEIDPDRILESDLLRWLLLGGEHKRHALSLMQRHLTPEDFHSPVCRALFQQFCHFAAEGGWADLLTLLTHVHVHVQGQGQGQVQDCSALLEEMMKKKVDKNREKDTIVETLQRMVNRRWMQNCETIRLKIQSGTCSDEEATVLSKQFTEYKSGALKVSWEDI